jgi:RimJ/RimL family protein N-acetyltransferase
VSAVVLHAPALVGRLVRLEPLTEAHAEHLGAAGADDRSTFGYTIVPDGADEARGYIRSLLDLHGRGETVPFAQVRVSDGLPVGVTRYLTIRMREGERLPYAVEIGGTWLVSSAQRSGINTEAKLLLFSHAFDTWGAERVDLKTDARNARSRAAMAALGATFEGVLRKWQPSLVAGEESELRDTAMYAVVRSEWPEIRGRLEARLG